MSEEEKEDKDEPLPGAATALSAPAQPLGADFGTCTLCLCE